MPQRQTRWPGYLIALVLFCGWWQPTCVSLGDDALGDDDRMEWSRIDQTFRDQQEGREALTSSAADFDAWENLVDDNHSARWGDPAVKPIDWARHFGFRHSSSDGRHVGKGIPLEGSSWLNRPYHADWFLGTMIGDNLIGGRVELGNELLAGLRLGWDFDYYWGMEMRFGWTKPNVQFEDELITPADASVFLADVDVVYYPWGDSKVRPYYLLGTGLSRFRFTDDTDFNRSVTLVTMPFGAGVVIQQWPWLAWRLEVLDNLAFGADGVNTMHNVSLTGGMEVRFGARPSSYWPWRSSRNVW